MFRVAAVVTVSVLLCACGADEHVATDAHVDAGIDAPEIDGVPDAEPDAMPPDAMPPDAAPTYAITVDALGVRAPVSIYVSAGDVKEMIEVDADGSFELAAGLIDGAAYAVQVLGAPPCVTTGPLVGILAGAPVALTLTCDGVVELSAISFSLPVELRPAWDPRRLVYAGGWPLLDQVIETIEATPTAAFPAEATVRVNGELVAPGASSASLAIDTGVTPEVTVEVTHASGLSRTYVFELHPGTGLEAYIKPSDTSPNDRFGLAVAIDGDVLAVCSRSAVYVFRRAGTTWAEEARLSVPGARFLTVDLDGDTLVTGVQVDDTFELLIYRKSSAWTLEGSFPIDVGYWHGPVAVDGDVVAAGAFASDDGVGSVFVYRRTGTTWAFEAELDSPRVITRWGELDADSLGVSVALAGDRVFAGAPSAEYLGEDGAGAVVVFQHDAGTWSETGRIHFDDGQYNTSLGFRIVHDDGVLVASASGGLVVMRHIAGEWILGQVITDASLTPPPSWSTYDLALSDGTLLVGGVYNDQFRAYVLRDDGGVWRQERVLAVPNDDDRSGMPLAIDGDTIVLGTSSDDSAATGIDGEIFDASASNAGAVFVYR